MILYLNFGILHITLVFKAYGLIREDTKTKRSLIDWETKINGPVSILEVSKDNILDIAMDMFCWE